MTYRGLGFDPTPGSVDAVARAVERLRAATDALSSVADAVADAGRHSVSWEGAAADAFRARLTTPPASTDQLRASIPVLEQWAATLATNQRRTEELDATALRLRRRLDDARDTLQDKQNALDLASTPAAAAVASVEVTAATGRVAEAESALEGTLAEARELARAHQRAADEAADVLDPGAAPTHTERAAVRALAGLLDRSSRASATIAGLVAPGQPQHAGWPQQSGEPHYAGWSQQSGQPQHVAQPQQSQHAAQQQPGKPQPAGQQRPGQPQQVGQPQQPGEPGQPQYAGRQHLGQPQPRPAVSAFAAALAAAPRGTGELIVLGEQRLPVSES